MSIIGKNKYIKRAGYVLVKINIYVKQIQFYKEEDSFVK